MTNQTASRTGGQNGRVGRNGDENSPRVLMKVSAEAQYVLALLARAEGVVVTRPPRSRSTVGLVCSHVQAEEFRLRTKRLLTCMTYFRFVVLRDLLLAWGIELPAPLLGEITELGLRIAQDEQLRALAEAIALWGEVGAPDAASTSKN